MSPRLILPLVLSLLACSDDSARLKPDAKLFPGDATSSERSATPSVDALSSTTDRSFVAHDSVAAAADAKPAVADGKPKAHDSKPLVADSRPAADSGGNDIGKPCTSYADCSTGLCAQNTHTGAWFCTKQCAPCAPSPCPAGTGCQNAGMMYICAPGYPNAPCP